MVEAPPILKKKKPIFLMVLCSLVGILAICALVFVLSYQTPEGQVRELVAQANVEIEAGNFSQADNLLDAALEIEDASNHGDVPVIRELLHRKKKEAERQRLLLAEEQQAQEVERQRELAEEQQAQEAERQRELAREQRTQEAERLAAEEELQRVKDEETARLRKIFRKELELARKAEEDKKPKQVEPLSLSDVLQKIFPSVVIVEAGNGHGSGFVIGPDLICTNHHVIDGAGSVKVVFKGGATREAQGTRFKSEPMDIAILKIRDAPAESLPLELLFFDPLVGDTVYAIGSPFGLKESVTNGIVSKVHSEKSAWKKLKHLSGTWIQTNAEINSGNSGGPLINSLGKVVGMSTLGSSTFLDKQGKIKGATNINFATSVTNIAKALRLAESGELSAFEANPKRKQERGRASRDGPRVTYYANGQKESERHWRDGRLDGLETEWYRNGQKSSEGHWKNGKKEGLSTRWYENGKEDYERHYKDGKLDGLFTDWKGNGQKVEAHYKDDKLEGLSTGWHADGNKSWEAHYKNGKIEGPLTKWHVNGQKSSEGHYKNGKIEGPLTKWYENGMKESEDHYKNGKKDGRWTDWYENGQKSWERHYKNGKKEGLWTYWHENGQKGGERHYKDGKSDGLSTGWHDNGVKKREQHYKNGKEEVLETWWDEDGRKILEVHYENGKEISRKEF